MNAPKLKLTIGGKTVEITAAEVRELRKQLAEFDDGQKAKEVAALNKQIAEREKEIERLRDQRESLRPSRVPMFPDLPQRPTWKRERQHDYGIGDVPPFGPQITCRAGN